MYGISHIRSVSVGLDSQIWYLFIYIAGYLNVRKISETMDFRTFVGPLEECDRTNTFWCIFLCLFCDLSFRVFWSFPLNQQRPERHALIRFLQHTKTSSRRLLKHAKNPPIQFSSENNSNWNFNAISKGQCITATARESWTFKGGCIHYLYAWKDSTWLFELFCHCVFEVPTNFDVKLTRYCLIFPSSSFLSL